MTVSTYDRIRAACCDIHGLGDFDPYAVDRHAAAIVEIVAQAKAQNIKQPWPQHPQVSDGQSQGGAV